MKVTDIEKIKKIMGTRKFSFHSCNMCGYHCGYIYRGDDLYYDSGCYCLNDDWHPRPPDAILKFFEMNPELDYDYIEKHLI